MKARVNRSMIRRSSGRVWIAQCLPQRMMGEISKEIRKINLDEIMQLICPLMMRYSVILFYDTGLSWMCF